MTRAREIANLGTSFSGTANNVSLGEGVLGSLTSGTNNVAIGEDALAANTTASFNTAVGYQAGYSNVTGVELVALGYEALYSSTATGNTGLGYRAGRNTTGDDNTFVGAFAGFDNTSGASNTSLGWNALSNNTTASNNTAVGYQALYSNTTGDSLTAVGYQALKSNTGVNNTAVGYQAFRVNTTGIHNAALGRAAGLSNTTGSYNVAIGDAALPFSTTASYNTAVGYQAMYLSNASGNAFNTSVGYASGYNLSTGVNNSLFGYNCGSQLTTGSKNTIIGTYNGNQNGLDIRTSSNQIVLSDGDGNPRIYVNSGGSTAIGTTVFDTANTTGVTLQKYSNGAYITIGKTSSAGNGEGYLNFHRNGSNIGGVAQASTSSVVFNTTSDYRLKENVVNLEGATARLLQLQPKRFEWINDTDGAVWDGFLAHEVQSIVPEAITGTHNEVEVWKDWEELPDGVSVGDNKLDDDGNTIPKYQGIDQSKLVPLLVATIKELETRITALENS